MAGSSLEIDDRESCRSYFAMLGDIVSRCRAKPVELISDARKGKLSALEQRAVDDYLARLKNAFAALSTRLLYGGTGGKPQGLTIDRTDSGYPVFQEFLQISADLPEIRRQLESLPDPKAIKSDMLDHVLARRTLPRRLQALMSRRLYFEILARQPVFAARNDPEILQIADRAAPRRSYLVRWAVYDSLRNMPNIYLLGLEESGDRPLAGDDRRWPRLAEQLTAQSLSSLKLLTIARGLDKDFPDIHPKRLRRLHLGPMYSNRFTRHADLVQDLLSEPEPGSGQDWIFCWSVETLRSKGSERKPSGLFGEKVSEVYDVDVHAPDEMEAGASTLDRGMILPHRPYQRLVERDRAELRALRKYVVGPDGLVLQ